MNIENLEYYSLTILTEEEEKHLTPEQRLPYDLIMVALADAERDSQPDIKNDAVMFLTGTGIYRDYYNFKHWLNVLNNWGVCDINAEVAQKALRERFLKC